MHMYFSIYPYQMRLDWVIIRPLKFNIYFKPMKVGFVDRFYNFIMLYMDFIATMNYEVKYL
jgi:hypothetical protein